MGNMLRRGESSWLCLKFEFAFFAGHGIFIRVLPPSFLALPVNELCLLFWPNPYTTSCFVLHIFFVRDFLTELSCFFGVVVRIPYEISCFQSA
jgi:hypothetical protein